MENLSFQNGLTMVEPSANLWTEVARTNIRLHEHALRNQMDIEKKTREEMAKADIRSARDLQQTKIFMSGSGQLIFTKERFGSSIKGALPIDDFSAVCLVPMGNPELWIYRLSFTFLSGHGKNVSIWIPGERVADETFVKRAFARCGISFGFSKMKEKEVLAGIILIAINIAKDIELPPMRGWYHVGSNVDYAFITEECWKGVEKWMQ